MNPLYIILPAFFIVFPLFWIVIIKVILKISGLYTLQEKYPIRTIIDYRKYRPHGSNSGRFNKANFNGTLKIHYNDDFLIIEMMKIFSFGFNGAQVPLEEIKYGGEKSIFFYKYHLFTMEGMEMQLAGNCDELIESLQKKTVSDETV